MRSPGLRSGSEDALLWVDGLEKAYGRRRRNGAGLVRALDGVSLDVLRGEVLGVVGESGSGKTTLARCILKLVSPDSGRIVFDGIELSTIGARELRALRSRLQCAFQDPYASLDPRYSVGRLVEEPLQIHGMQSAGERAARVAEILELVGIAATSVERRPHEFSGGQRQRIALARALVMHPDMVVLDEPVSALDVSVQAQILNLLADLRDELQLTYVLIVHDLLVAEYFCDRVAVVYAGKVMELAPSDELFSRPSHPYTASLLAAAPMPDPMQARAQLEAGSALDRGVEDRPVGGCPFRLRCAIGRDRATCAEEMPPLVAEGPDHWVACHFSDELRASAAVAAVPHGAAG
jgi:oligopeptide/dipeptide ABC transporter ATP-binding protein